MKIILDTHTGKSIELTIEELESLLKEAQQISSLQKYFKKETDWDEFKKAIEKIPQPEPCPTYPWPQNPDYPYGPTITHYTSDEDTQL